MLQLSKAMTNQSNENRPTSMVGAARFPLGHSSILNVSNEILHLIAGYLPTDRDMVNLSLACKELHLRILGSSSGVWKYRYEANYDLPGPKRMMDLENEYKVRAIVLSQKMNFRGRNMNQREELWMDVIYTMLVESLTIPVLPSGPKTYNRLREVMSANTFLSHPKKPKPSEFTCAIQLCLTALALHRDVSEPCPRSEYELAVVYSFANEPNGPYITHYNLDLNKILQIRSFWQRHFLEPDEMTFYMTFKELDEDFRPKLRKACGVPESELSTYWLGYYSCLHQERLRNRTEFNKSSKQTCVDVASHLRPDAMEMVLGHNETQFWPSECNALIPMCSSPDIKRAFFHGLQWYPGTQYGEANYVFGFTETILYPYGGISGWSRICFTIIAGEHLQESLEWVHGYEALLLPGGRIMIGRWLDMKDTSGRGPFIFWDVDVPFLRV